MSSEELKRAITSILPDLPDHTLNDLIGGLQDIGVDRESDFPLVQEADLERFLRPIQCRRLLKAWACEGI